MQILPELRVEAILRRFLLAIRSASWASYLCRTRNIGIDIRGPNEFLRTPNVRGSVLQSIAGAGTDDRAGPVHANHDPVKAGIVSIGAIAQKVSAAQRIAESDNRVFQLLLPSKMKLKPTGCGR